MKPRNRIAVLFVILSFAVLIPGLIRPLITITASLEMFGRSTELFRETRSIVQTIQSLHESGNTFVAGLILLFGIVVPFVKGACLVTAIFLKRRIARARLERFVEGISKWAMNDVFIVAVYVAFLSAKATDNLDARIEVGFYYFAAYCLLSLCSLQLLDIQSPPAPEKEPAAEPA
jgi:uncharacterized paraquat-inducible protein A